MKLETKLKHTPAPWHVMGDVNRTFIYTDWHTDEDGADRRDEIAIIDTVENAYPCLPEATAQANARLIAAAPDMLDALMAQQHCATVDNAILKALGQEAFDDYLDSMGWVRVTKNQE